MVDDAIVSAGAGLLGALVGGGAAICAAMVAARRTERAALSKEQRDLQRQQLEAIRIAQAEAATAIIDDLQAMRSLWLEPAGALERRAERTKQLWDLHERIRVRALILPARVREDLAVLVRSMRFADELGGDAFRPDGFIFLSTSGVANVAFEAGQEQLSRFIAGDQELPWPPDGLRLRAAHDDLMSERTIEYAQEGHEYEEERRAFDLAHPTLTGKVHNAKQLRRSPED